MPSLIYLLGRQQPAERKQLKQHVVNLFILPLFQELPTEKLTLYQCCMPSIRLKKTYVFIFFIDPVTSKAAFLHCCKKTAGEGKPTIKPAWECELIRPSAQRFLLLQAQLETAVLFLFAFPVDNRKDIIKYLALLFLLCSSTMHCESSTVF